MSVPSATLNEKEERRLLRGHMWAYRNEFRQLPAVEDGAVIDVFAANRRFVGRGFYQARGGIAVRLLSAHQEDIDGAFLQQRVAAAAAFRARLFPGSEAYRWIFGESDGFPGLVADRYGSVVSLQTTCMFYAKHVEALTDAFLTHEGVRGVRLDVNNAVSTFGEVPDSVTFGIEGLRLQVAFDGAQKTGMFLDQRLNTLAVNRFAPGARVLDGHCHLGQWSCRAALAGAASVLGVDTSAAALELARENAQRNGVADRCAFEQAEIETVLARGGQYDVIILDPPAFAKTRALAPKALPRYQALNAAALRVLAPGGILITCSCSHFIDSQAFLECLKRAANAAQRNVALLELRGASPDHPVLLAMPETAYLKCAVLKCDGT